MSALRPNAVSIRAGWLAISGPCISKVEMAALLNGAGVDTRSGDTLRPNFTQRSFLIAISTGTF